MPRFAQRSAAAASRALIEARYGFGSSSRQKSNQRMRSVANAIASSMQWSRSRSCASAPKSAPN